MASANHIEYNAKSRISGNSHLRLTMTTWWLEFSESGDCCPRISCIDLGEFFASPCMRCKRMTDFRNQNHYGFFISDSCPRGYANEIPTGKIVLSHEEPCDFYFPLKNSQYPLLHIRNTIEVHTEGK